MPKVETFDRTKVLQDATHVFHNKGYNGTSMQDLVDATGLNRSSIYNSFGSKLGIFTEVLGYYQFIGKNRMNKEIVSSHNASDTITGIFNMYLHEIVADKESKGCLIVNCKSEMSNQDPLIKSFMEQNQTQVLAMLEDVVHKGQMQRLFNENHRRSICVVLIFFLSRVANDGDFK